MVERIKRGYRNGSQMVFPIPEVHRLGATHIVYPGARIRVNTKTGKGFAWCTAETSFDVALYRREPGMSLFVAKEPFCVWYSPNLEGRDGSEIKYPFGTQLYAFNNPKNGTVVKIPGSK